MKMSNWRVSEPPLGLSLLFYLLPSLALTATSWTLARSVKVQQGWVTTGVFWLTMLLHLIWCFFCLGQVLFWYQKVGLDTQWQHYLLFCSMLLAMLLSLSCVWQGIKTRVWH